MRPDESDAFSMSPRIVLSRKTPIFYRYLIKKIGYHSNVATDLYFRKVIRLFFCAGFLSLFLSENRLA